jgi:hypothetical protein
MRLTPLGRNLADFALSGISWVSLQLPAVGKYKNPVMAVLGMELEPRSRLSFIVCIDAKFEGRKAKSSTGSDGYQKINLDLQNWDCLEK